MKKLIFAVEQSALSKQHQQTAGLEQPSQGPKADENWMEISSYQNLPTQSKGTDRTIVLKSVADHNFGSIDNSMQAMLPTIASEQSTQRKTDLGDFQWSTSFLESAGTSRSTTGNHNTSDIIFLRRLLFLKQSLDYDSSADPLIEEDQAFRLQRSECERDGIVSAPYTERKNHNHLLNQSIGNEEQHHMRHLTLSRDFNDAPTHL